MRKPTVLPLLLLLLAAPAGAWTDATHEAIASLATELMPARLKAELVKNRVFLLEGARAPDRQAPPVSHALHCDGSGGTLDVDTRAAVGRAVEVMRSRGTFADFARELGMVSHLVADAAFPLNTSASDPREPELYDDYAAYAARKQAKFPPIFDGYRDLGKGFDVVAYVRSVAETANRAYPLVMAAYYPKGTGRQSSTRFEDQSPVFGVTQLAYVHAVSATANLWLYAWKQVNGDVGQTPFYPARRESKREQENRPSAAKRP